jgi:hypothetical protein
MKKESKKTVEKSYSSDEVKRYLGSLSEDFQHKVSAIGEQFGGLNVRMDTIDKKLDVHTQMIGQLMTDVQEIKNDLKQKVDRTEFARLEKRVLAIESREYFGKSRK